LPQRGLRASFCVMTVEREGDLRPITSTELPLNGGRRRDDRRLRPG
jgi:hypothetical protein